MKDKFREIEARVGELVLGKEEAVRLALTCLFARGHLLIEDVPGVGKTLLAHTLATTLGLTFSRVQFTSDLMPADILGVNVYDAKASVFRFHQGPIFTQVLLADEINRASPKTQSALLEAMEERQASVEGVTRRLPEPFFVIATQNPVEQAGTFPLPESQLDRFLMRIRLGYPDEASERRLWREADRRDLLAGLNAALDGPGVSGIQAKADAVHLSEPLLDYVHRLVLHTRRPGLYRLGLSPRAGHSVIRAARAWALMEGRAFVTPDDVQAVFPSVAGHRLQKADATGPGDAAELLKVVEVPA